MAHPGMKERRFLSQSVRAPYENLFNSLRLSSFVARTKVVTFKPQIVNKIVGQMEKPRKIFESVVTADIKMKKQVFKIVKEGMQGVVNEKSGTAYGGPASRMST